MKLASFEIDGRQSFGAVKGDKISISVLESTRSAVFVVCWPPMPLKSP
jgi:hypothetical protein